MKLSSSLKFLLLSILFIPKVFGAELLPEELLEDVRYKGAVILQNYEVSQSSSVQSTSAKAEVAGFGSLLLESRDGKSKMLVPGETTLEVSSDVSSGRATIWNGELSAPKRSVGVSIGNVAISDYLISSSNANSPKLNLINAYIAGNGNQVFKYSNEVQLGLNISRANGTRVWVARQERPGTAWSIEAGDFCVVQSSTCVVPVENFYKISLYTESFQRCPKSRISNGQRSTITPSCTITCSLGFVRDYKTDRCVDKDQLERDDSAFYLFAGGTTGPVYPGYFRWRNSYQEQVGKEIDLEGIRDLVTADRYALRARQDASLNIRKNETQEDHSFLGDIQKKIEDLKYKLFQETSRQPVRNTEHGTLFSEENTTNNVSKTFQQTGILPRTGTGTLALWALGVILFVLFLGKIFRNKKQ